MNPSRARLVGAIALPLLLATAATHAQHLEPRAYINLPLGTSFLVAGYSYSSGGLATDPAVPLTNAQLDIHTPFAAYARVFDAWGKSAKFDAVVGGGCLDGNAESNGVPVSRDICGLLDPTMRVAVNLYGAPALEAKDFASYRQDLILGASLQLQAPLGQYDPSRLVNLGSNRWALRPEIGISKLLGRLLVEGVLSATFYTTNDDFFGGQRREQDPVLATQIHLIYLLRGGAWIAFDANYYSGGRSTVNGTFTPLTSVAVVVGPTSSPAIALGSPLSNSTSGSTVTVNGWAVDTGAPSGTGVDMIHVYAFPTSGGSPVPMGAATYGLSRPDVGAIFGAQFNNSGFQLQAPVEHLAQQRTEHGARDARQGEAGNNADQSAGPDQLRPPPSAGVRLPPGARGCRHPPSVRRSTPRSPGRQPWRGAAAAPA